MPLELDHLRNSATALAELLAVSLARPKVDLRGIDTACSRRSNATQALREGARVIQNAFQP